MLLLCRPPEGGQNSGHRVACFDHLVGNRLNCVRCSEWYWKSFWIVWLWVECCLRHHAHLGHNKEKKTLSSAMVTITYRLQRHLLVYFHDILIGLRLLRNANN